MLRLIVRQWVLLVLVISFASLIIHRVFLFPLNFFREWLLPLTNSLIPTKPKCFIIILNPINSFLLNRDEKCSSTTSKHYEWKKKKKIMIINKPRDTRSSKLISD